MSFKSQAMVFKERTSTHRKVHRDSAGLFEVSESKNGLRIARLRKERHLLTVNIGQGRAESSVLLVTHSFTTQLEKIRSKRRKKLDRVQHPS